MARRSILVIAGQPRSLVNFRGPLLLAMREKGHRVSAAAPELSGDPASAAMIEEMGIALRDIPLSRTGMNPLADFRLLLALVRLMRSERPNVVLAFTMKAVIFGLIAAAIARVPRRYALITGVGYAFIGAATGKRRLARTMARALYRVALGQAHKVFFQNPDDEALFREFGMLPDAIPVARVNGSGVDLDQFRPVPLPDGPIRFMLAARLLSAKGIREYAAAAEQVRRTHPEAQFHLVGGFDSNPDALSPAEVESWRGAGTLIWHGQVADVRPLLADSHVFVLPSYREGTPRSVLEAMALGRPIITTDAPGCRETVIEGENGFLVPPRSVEPLAEAMERVLADPGLIERMGRASRALAETKYDVREVNARMLHEMELA